MWELNYNIHNLLSIKIQSRGKKDPTGNLKYSYFATSGYSEEPDITLNIGPFKPSYEEAEHIAHKYYVKENYFYCRERGSKSKWEIEIFGFEKGKTVINFFGRYRGIRGIVFPTFMAQEFLIPIIEYKLARKNYFLIHGGAVCKSNTGFVLTGRPGVWKTSLLLDLMRTNKYKFLGDDRIIIKEDGSLLSFPTSLFLFNYTLINSKTEKRNAFDNFRLLLQVLTNKTEKNSITPIAECARIKKIIFVARKTNQNIDVRPILNHEGIQKIITNNMAESVESTKKSPIGQYSNYVLVYSLIFPDNDIVKHSHRLSEGLSKIAGETQMSEITMPFIYDQTAIEIITYQIIQGE